jgi:hypothetical protein
MAAEFAIGPHDLIQSPPAVLDHLWRIATARWENRMKAIEENQRDRMRSKLKGL